MKLKYIGHAPMMTLSLPLGARKQAIKEKIQLNPGDVFELPDAEAKKLLEGDAETLQSDDLSREQFRNLGSPELQEQKDGSIKRQRFYIPYEGKDSDEGEETEAPDDEDLDGQESESDNEEADADQGQLTLNEKQSKADKKKNKNKKK